VLTMMLICTRPNRGLPDPSAAESFAVPGRTSQTAPEPEAAAKQTRQLPHQLQRPPNTTPIAIPSIGSRPTRGPTPEAQRQSHRRASQH
jgi:hypothetical protein